MKLRDVIIMLVLVFEIIFGIAIWIRIDIDDYDIKADHILMETNYCPYCGKKLEQGGEK